MQNNSFEWQFSVWHKTSFGIIDHSLSKCSDFLVEKISTLNLEPVEV